jgi:hypothetical protein
MKCAENVLYVAAPRPMHKECAANKFHAREIRGNLSCTFMTCRPNGLCSENPPIPAPYHWVGCSCRVFHKARTTAFVHPAHRERRVAEARFRPATTASSSPPRRRGVNKSRDDVH